MTVHWGSSFVHHSFRYLKKLMMATASKPKSKTLQLIQQNAHRLRFNTPTDYDPILAAIGNARIVMIGEASHGISFKRNDI